MRTISAIDAQLAKRTQRLRSLPTGHPEAGELRAEVDALLEERHRCRTPLRPSRVLADPKAAAR